MNQMVGHLWFVTIVAVDILHITIGRGGRPYARSVEDRADVHSVQTSYAFKLLLDEMKSLGVAMRLELEDRR